MISAKLIEDVKALFENDFSGHDFFHTLRVLNTAKAIAEAENADMETVELAALLHDTDDVKLFGGETQNADALMAKYGYSEDMRKKVADIIKNISFKGSGTAVPESVEGRIVQDADRLDAIGAVGIARAFAYGGSRSRPMYDPDVLPRTGMSEAEYRSGSGTTICHFYEKLLLLKELMNTETAGKIAEERHRYMVRFLDEFYAEWDGKR